MLDQLKKKKALESLRTNDNDSDNSGEPSDGDADNGRSPSSVSDFVYKSYAPEILKGASEKAKFMSNMKELPPEGDSMYKPSLTDKPVYEELNKIPVEEQADLINKQHELDLIRLRNNPELGKPPTEEEKKQELLKKLRNEDIKKNQRYS